MCIRDSSNRHRKRIFRLWDSRLKPGELVGPRFSFLLWLCTWVLQGWSCYDSSRQSRAKSGNREWRACYGSGAPCKFLRLFSHMRSISIPHPKAAFFKKKSPLSLTRWEMPRPIGQQRKILLKKHTMFGTVVPRLQWLRRFIRQNYNGWPKSATTVPLSWVENVDNIIYAQVLVFKMIT